MNLRYTTCADCPCMMQSGDGDQPKGRCEKLDEWIHPDTFKEAATHCRWNRSISHLPRHNTMHSVGEAK